MVFSVSWEYIKTVNEMCMSYVYQIGASALKIKATIKASWIKIKITIRVKFILGLKFILRMKTILKNLFHN